MSEGEKKRRGEEKGARMVGGGELEQVEGLGYSDRR